MATLTLSGVARAERRRHLGRQITMGGAAVVDGWVGASVAAADRPTDRPEGTCFKMIGEWRMAGAGGRAGGRGRAGRARMRRASHLWRSSLYTLVSRFQLAAVTSSPAKTLSARLPACPPARRSRPPVAVASAPRTRSSSARRLPSRPPPSSRETQLPMMQQRPPLIFNGAQ